ncbi:MAG: hypothetical protein LAP40_12370 [Acidobacteriia bacterium]|nr:hypothetical protein [Terriglobia bacterium]
MVLRLRIGSKDDPAGKWRSGHRLLSLLYSVSLHGGLLAFAFLGPEWSAPDPTVYRSTIVALEKEHKVIYYDFRKELPEVSAANPSSKITTPTPNELKSKQRIVTAPREKEGKQFVFLPEPKVTLQQDLKAPNLIALAPPVTVPVPDRPKPRAFQAPEPEKAAPRPAPALPSAPPVTGVTTDQQSAELAALLHKPVAGPPPKEFTPPKEAKVAPPPVAPLPNAPQIAVTTSGAPSAELENLLRRPVAGPPPKEFTPPKVAKLAAPEPTLSLPSTPPVAGIAGSRESVEVSALLNRPLAGPPPKPFAPPSRTNSGSATPAVALPAAPSVAESRSPASASVAIVGLNPANVPQIPVPEGSRPVRIVAGAPVPGATHPELGGGTSPIAAPSLSIEGKLAVSPSTATRAPLERSPAQPATGLARVQMPQVLPTTPHVSVPQWPNTRSLPAAVEHHFQNRVVYITLIPSRSGDDWVVWFGELTPTPTNTQLLMRPPTLVRSGGLPPFPAHSDHGTGSIRVVAMIHKDGQVDATSDLAGAGLDRELAAALHAWQFSPATRNGVAIDADAVIDIPVVFGTLSLR